MENRKVKITFLICGAPKCGTTSMYEYMKDHPNVLMSSNKEPKFFFKGDKDEAKKFYEKISQITRGSRLSVPHPPKILTEKRHLRG